MEDLSQIFNQVRGVPIASLAELQQFAYAVPEHLVPPPVLTRFTAGEEVPPDELYRAVSEAGPKVLETSSEQDAGLEALRSIRERLEAAFPELGAPSVAAEIIVRTASVELLDELAPLYAELHELQVAVAPEMAGLAPVSADAAWRRRRTLYEREVARGAIVVLARSHGVSIGYGIASVQEGYSGWGAVTTRVGVIHDLVVAKRSRGAGVGSAILDQTRTALAERGASVLRLNVVAGNTEAVRFYERHGLRPLAQVLGVALSDDA